MEKKIYEKVLLKKFKNFKSHEFFIKEIIYLFLMFDVNTMNAFGHNIMMI